MPRRTGLEGKQDRRLRHVRLLQVEQRRPGGPKHGQSDAGLELVHRVQLLAT